jgi:hypothetical protein
MSTALPLTSVPPPEPGATITVAAIDNGLSFPFKHPDRFRVYPYGWAYLPISRVPFSSNTRSHVLHFLTSPEWWNETLEGLEQLFRIDPDFSEGMWRRQKSVIRGEGYNLAEVLRRAELGDSEGGSPWALVRRPVVAVYEEEVGVSGGDGDGDGDLSGSFHSFVDGVTGHHYHSGSRGDGGSGGGGGGGVGGAGANMARRLRRVKQRFESFASRQPWFSNC